MSCFTCAMPPDPLDRLVTAALNARLCAAAPSANAREALLRAAADRQQANPVERALIDATAGSCARSRGFSRESPSRKGRFAQARLQHKPKRNPL